MTNTNEDQLSQTGRSYYKIGDNGNWWEGYDGSSWIDTGEVVNTPGPIYIQGIQGPRGPRGTIGELIPGPKGDPGPAGPPGPEGPRGTQGVQGVAGKDFSIAETFPSIASMSGAGLTKGDFVMISSTVEDPDNAKLYLWNGTEFTFITDMSGATGIKGDTGEQGIQGDQGIQGIQGPPGPQGKPGKDGTNADSAYKTITIEGSPLDLSQGVRTFTAFDSITGENIPNFSVNIISSNWTSKYSIHRLTFLQSSMDKAAGLDSYSAIITESTLDVHDCDVYGSLEIQDTTRSMQLKLVPADLTINHQAFGSDGNAQIDSTNIEMGGGSTKLISEAIASKADATNVVTSVNGFKGDAYVISPKIVLNQRTDNTLYFSWLEEGSLKTTEINTIQIVNALTSAPIQLTSPSVEVSYNVGTINMYKDKDNATITTYSGSTMASTVEDYTMRYIDFTVSESGSTNVLLYLEPIYDPGGKILSELIRSRKPEGYASAYPDLPTRLDKQIGKNTDFRSFESDKSFMTRVYNESAERGLNVKWFGAVGDGVSDDTTAIQNAINSLVTSHGTVYFPRGNYKHTGITLTSGISLIGESWDNTKLVNTSATNDSISIQGAGMVWPENYQISNLFITSNAISGDTRCAINNYINRNFKYDHVRISNHGIGLKEKGSWYSEHIMLDIANCDKGIFIPAYSIPGTPNSFTDCIIRKCRVGLNIETGIDVFVWRGGHIGGCSEKAIFLDNTKAYNMRSVSFDSTNFEGNLGIEDVVISANGTTSDNGYIHSILFTNCRFAQWSTRITGKIGVAINYGAEIISLVNCYFINYATCVVDNSSFVNGQTLLEQCGMTSSDFGFNLKGTIGNFNSINGHYRGKYFSYPAGIENIASALTIHANATLVLAEKQLDHVKIVLDVNDQIGNMQDLIVFSSNKYMRKANTAFKTGTYSVLMYPAAGYLKCQNTPALIAGTQVTLDYFIN